MQNYMLPILNDYFKEIMAIEGNTHLSTGSLNAHKDKVLNGIDETFSVESITTYRDLSIPKGKNNLFTPQYDHSVLKSNLEEGIEVLISKYCCFAVSQAYEVFESYLINILTEYLFINHQKLNAVKFTSGNLALPKDTLRIKIKREQDTNNRGLLKMIRSLSPHFQNYERVNNFDVDFSVWFELLSLVRHTLVHNRQIISNKLLNHIKKNKLDELFNRHFQRKMIDGNVCIFLTSNLASETINWLNSYAHLIFSGLSIDTNLSTSVPQYQLPPLNPSKILVRFPNNN